MAFFERLARWILRREIIDWQIAKMAAWNEGFQTGYRVAERLHSKYRSNAYPSK